MKRVIVGFALIFFSQFSAIAAEKRITHVGFAAPTIIGTSNVYDPETGAIVYDQNTSTFYGFDHSSSWVPLGGSSQTVPAGVISAFGGASAPSGYLICDGSAVNRTTYASLFAAIGTAYGSGNGSTTFNLPDLRGRFLRGVDSGSGNDADASSRTAMASGGNTGNNVGSIQTDAFQGHRHSSNAMTGTTTSPVGGGVNFYTTSSAVIGDPITDGTNGTPRTTSETRPKNAYVNYIIKY